MCRAQVVEITDLQTQKEIFRHLVYKEKRRGRVLSKSFPALGLPKFARLMPTRTMTDVAKFEHTTIPFSSSWWVASPDARVVHDCPLTTLSGVGLDMWSLDLMHAWHLGPMQQFVSLAMNHCLDSGLWAPDTALDVVDRKRISLLSIKTELFSWYKTQRLDPDWRGKGSEESSHYD